MRLILIAPYCSITAKEDAILLAMRGYDAITTYDLHHKDYRFNSGMPASPSRANQNLALELLDGAIAVVHPEASQEQVHHIAMLCRLFETPLIPLHDLDAVAAHMSPERIDACNIAGSDAPAPPPESVSMPCHDPGDEHRRRGAAPTSLRQKLAIMEERINRFLGDHLKNPMTRTAKIRPLRGRSHLSAHCSG